MNVEQKNTIKTRRPQALHVAALHAGEQGRLFVDNRPVSMQQKKVLTDNRHNTILKKRANNTAQTNNLESINQDLLDSVQQSQTKPLQLAKNNSNTVALGGVIQRYLEENLDGALDEESYQHRAESEARGFNSFGNDNLARARIILADGQVVTKFAYSQFGVRHSEEKLIAEISATYGAEVLTRAPDAEGQTRIVEIYTERKPCAPGNAEPARQQRVLTERSCQAYLAAMVHANLPVKYSVPNVAANHGTLMNDAKARLDDEFANDQRRMTFQNANNRGFRYFAGIRTACFNRHRTYGRDYITERERVRQYIAQFSATVEALNLEIDYRTPLIRAFESVPHYLGNDAETPLVLQRLVEASQNIQHQIDQAIAHIQEQERQMDAYAAMQNDQEEEQRQYIIARMEQTGSSEIVSLETGMGEEEIMEIWNSRHL